MIGMETTAWDNIAHTIRETHRMPGEINGPFQISSNFTRAREKAHWNIKGKNFFEP